MARIGGKVSAPQVKMPRRDAGFVPHMPDHRLFPAINPPRIKPIKTRIYNKGIVPNDPSDFSSSGFGSTGRSGES